MITGRRASRRSIEATWNQLKCFSFSISIEATAHSKNHLFVDGKASAASAHMLTETRRRVKDLLIKLYTQRMSSSRIIIKVKNGEAENAFLCVLLQVGASKQKSAQN